MMWKVTVCCWQETPSNFLVVERWSHCSKTQNETEHWSFVRYFRRRSYPENLHLFLHVLRGHGFFSSSKKRLRSGHEIPLRGKFPGDSYHEQKGTFVVCNRRFLFWTNVNSPETNIFYSGFSKHFCGNIEALMRKNSYWIYFLFNYN